MIISYGPGGLLDDILARLSEENLRLWCYEREIY